MVLFPVMVSIYFLLIVFLEHRLKCKENLNIPNWTIQNGKIKATVQFFRK
jgi:hypothetical protein